MTLQINDLSDDIGMASAPVGLVLVRSRPGLYRNVLKRLIDILAIALSGVIALPVIIVLALLVARDGHSPFYRSDRVGRGGRTFRMLKLRTMVPAADQMLDVYLHQNAAARLEWDCTQKLKDDPRITGIGRFLRKTSLDELPQLWNVLVGDMSLVGPRPMMPNQRALYNGLAYYALRPGITGSWQVSDRNECEFSKRAEYERNMSFETDIRLLMATVRVVCKGTGY